MIGEHRAGARKETKRGASLDCAVRARLFPRVFSPRFVSRLVRFLVKYLQLRDIEQVSPRVTYFLRTRETHYVIICMYLDVCFPSVASSAHGGRTFDGGSSLRQICA